MVYSIDNPVPPQEATMAAPITLEIFTDYV